jgi:protein O-mannosyl-transferase
MKHRPPKKSKDAETQAPVSQPTPSVNWRSAASWALRHRGWFLAAALAMAVFLVYSPAWHGGILWDDEAHLTPPGLQSLHGLFRIWFDLKATQQYYPLVHSAFWLESQLWGYDTLGYHLVNILLHVVATILVATILRRLMVPGAYLAAAIFAFHPVCVETVAWITELKNTLSAVFYLSAALVYLHFDWSRRKSTYAAALALFVLGLLCKTVTATLPAALLVVFWWKRGRLSWRRDVLPLLPFFVLGMVAGLFTAWVEHSLGGAGGSEFNFTLVERCLIAGRAVWFYLGKLFWPVELTFIYPRWHVSQAEAWQYVFPAGALLLIVGLWTLRRRSRGPLAAMLYFVGTLFPALGFFNVYPFLFSFVADHFQYLASLGIITLVSAGIATAFIRRGLWGQWPAYAICGILLFALATRTFAQCWMYTDLQLLYITTIERNPDCWMAYNNLGELSSRMGNPEQAMECYRNAIRIKPTFDKAHLNLSMVLLRFDDVDGAMKQCRIVLDADPDSAEGHALLGNVYLRMEKFHKAAAEQERALQICPEYADAHLYYSLALAGLGHIDEALAEFDKAIALRTNLPMVAQVRENLKRMKAEASQSKDGLPKKQDKDREAEPAFPLFRPVSPVPGR